MHAPFQGTPSILNPIDMTNAGVRMVVVGIDDDSTTASGRVPTGASTIQSTRFALGRSEVAD